MKHFLVLEVEDDTPDEMYTIGILNYLNRVADGKTRCERLSPPAHAALIQAVEMALSQMKKTSDAWSRSPDPVVRLQGKGYERFIDALSSAARVLGDPFTDNVPDTIAGIEHS